MKQFIFPLISNFCWFSSFLLCPRDRRSRGILFSFCHSVLLSETITLLITFEQWVLKLWYFTGIFPVIRPLSLTMWPWLWSLSHFFKTLTLLITFEQWQLELLYFTLVFLVIRPFRGFHCFLINLYQSFYIAHEHFLWQDLPTGIKIFVLVTLTIFGIGHYRGHLCFSNASCFFLMKDMEGHNFLIHNF